MNRDNNTIIVMIDSQDLVGDKQQIKDFQMLGECSMIIYRKRTQINTVSPA